MRKSKKSPSALDMLGELGLDNVEEGGSVTDLSNDIIDGEDDTDVDKIDNTEQPDEDKDTTGGTGEDETDIPQEVLDRMNNKQTTSETLDGGSEEEEPGEPEDVTEAEVQGVGAFFDAFAEALNWDVEEDERPQSIDDLISYIEDVVNQNSTPEYADDRIAQLDQYVKNGGKFEDFYSNMQERLSYDNLDMEDESNQKAVVRDYMKLQGFNDEQINRKIERYEDADMLEDEAADAIAQLKSIREYEAQQAAQEQERIRIAQEEQARQFMTDLNSSIASLDNIRGIAVPKEDRKKLLDYITKTDADGLTQYQKDFNQNMVNNLIESAYFTMKGDSLLGEARRNGQTSAASKLRTMLKHQQKNHSSVDINEKPVSALDLASKFF